ncbi:MAG: hypothetical protein JJE46_01990 [Acidimicrobiia bacterium]|nr:hypothetical protein [Acidimicrobiia bacterium]
MTVTPHIRICAAIGVVVLGLGLTACSGDDSPSVDVTLSEWIVEPDPVTVDAGDIEFTGDNAGGETHEMVVVAAKDADALPTDADGAVVEDELPKGALIGEIEDIEAQSSKQVTLKLKAGDYVLFCNVTEEQDDGTIESHFAKGMHSVLTVK